MFSGVHNYLFSDVCLVLPCSAFAYNGLMTFTERCISSPQLCSSFIVLYVGTVYRLGQVVFGDTKAIHVFIYLIPIELFSLSLILCQFAYSVRSSFDVRLMIQWFND